jgi:hypothetical protein
LSIKRLPLAKQPYLWGVGLGSFALGLVNGAFVISMGVGWVAYKQLQSLSPRQWATLRQSIEKALPLPGTMQRQAMVLSLLLAASTYTMTALWQSTHSMLMALVLLGQTTLTFFVVGLMLRSGKRSAPIPSPQMAPTLGYHHDLVERERSSPSSTESVDPLEYSLSQLTHPDPLQRLVAIRRLVKLIDGVGEEKLYAVGAQVSLRSHLLDCFHIMLAHETEPIVRTAVREGLSLLRQVPQLPEGPPPFPQDNALRTPALQPESQPVEEPSTHRQGRRTAVEYVEYIEP